MSIFFKKNCYYEFYPFTRKPHKMIKPTQTICVWPFCGVDA